LTCHGKGLGGGTVSSRSGGVKVGREQVTEGLASGSTYLIYLKDGERGGG
jgi:hypothetical protein